MYRLILYNVICVIIVSVTIVNNCLKGNKKGSENKKPSKSTPPPVSYETDPAVLERERKLKIRENREKMRKKREKNQVKTVEKTKTISEKKVKELLPEDVTQKTTTSEESGEVQMPEKSMNKTQKLEEGSANRGSSDSKVSSDEELGDVQLVDNHQDATEKMAAVKKQAKEAARQKQIAEEVARSLDRSEHTSKIRTPDDTTRNISSIKIESQMSECRRKKQQQDGVKTGGDTTESIMIKEATLIEPKSNPMYLQQFTQHVMRGSAEPNVGN